ncbi:BTAD domain-containing putative transcriptional regulator [Kribbella sp. NPDC049227]|uniref:AfsR/SARP family transcriptional regulator n=1 Tax=Kribbella sp. NPDC049227 TaxID=3364113 RepID=UPI00371C6970
MRILPREGEPELGSARFGLLGPIEAWHGAERLQLGRRRERALLAILLLEANRLVSADRVIDLLWDGSPSDSARASLRSHVSRLRSCLLPAGRDRYGVRLEARGGGYLLATDPAAIDVNRFSRLVQQARDTVDVTARGRLLREALSLWRGPALADASSDLLRRRLATDLDELRLVATELAIDADLDCGRHEQAVAEVHRLIGDHPYREGLWARLALGLYRAGRQADALQVLAQARDRLTGELGLDPGPELRKLQQKILTCDPTLAPAAAGPVVAVQPSKPPQQVPMDIPEFTGRDGEQATLTALAAPAAQGRGSQPVVCAIEGMAGVGKTRFAIHAAHDLVRRGWFDEVRLWADLHGFDPQRTPADPGTVLGGFLRQLGVPGWEVPEDLEARAALYRSHLAGRRALVLLDNAAFEEQVRPLLPGSGPSLVLITSRRRLSGLDGVQPIPLDVFTRAEAIALLARIAGPERVAGHEADAARIASLCGHLPMAITLAARRLRGHPTWTLGDLARRLSADVSQEASFNLSYDALPPQRQRVFRRLGLNPGDQLTPQTAAALSGRSVAEADAHLEALLDEYLLYEVEPGRYRMHDLVLAYARDRAQTDESEQARHAAVRRLLASYLTWATQATLLVHPTESRRVARTLVAGQVELRTPTEAIAWTEVNLADLVATIRRALELPGNAPHQAVRLVHALYRPLANRGHSRERITLNELAADAAGRSGDQEGEAQTLEDLGVLCGQVGRLAEAVRHTKRALELWRETGNHIGEAGCLTGLGITYRQLGQLDEAVACLREGLAINLRIGHVPGEASALNHLGLALQSAGCCDEAIVCGQQSIARHRDLGDRTGEALALANLGWAYLRSRQPSRAIDCHRAALPLFRDWGDRYNESEQLWGIGQAYHALGDDDRARVHWHESITILRDLDVLRPAQAEVLLGQPVPDTPEIIRLNS